MKSQAVRVLDVIVLGPLLMLMASRTRRLTPIERGALWWIGLGTVLYNAGNWWRIAHEDGP